MCILWCNVIDRDIVLDTMVVVEIVIIDVISRVMVDVVGG